MALWCKPAALRALPIGRRRWRCHPGSQTSAGETTRSVGHLLRRKIGANMGVLERLNAKVADSVSDISDMPSLFSLRRQASHSRVLPHVLLLAVLRLLLALRTLTCALRRQPAAALPCVSREGSPRPPLKASIALLVAFVESWPASGCLLAALFCGRQVDGSTRPLRRRLRATFRRLPPARSLPPPFAFCSSPFCEGAGSPLAGIIHRRASPPCLPLHQTPACCTRHACPLARARRPWAATSASMSGRRRSRRSCAAAP